MQQRDPLIILFGGESSERRVSVASAQHLVEVLPAAECWFWAPTGCVHEVSRTELSGHERAFERDFVPSTAARWKNCEHAFDEAPKQAVFVLALHGVGGEDGQVQAWLEKRRLAFTGSGAQASQRAFDKITSKMMVREHGVRVAEFEIVSGRDLAAAEHVIAQMRARFGRVVVKPVADGSSHGLCFVVDAASLARAVEQLAAEPEARYLAEPFIGGTELTVGVYDDVGGTRALPVSEVRLENGRAFDYAGKYLGAGTREVTPAEVPDAIRDAAQKVAVTAHRALGLRGYSRTDLIVDGEGPVFLEINNLPGLTRASFVPQQLAAAGISMSEFITRQIALARARYDSRVCASNLVL